MHLMSNGATVHANPQAASMAVFQQQLARRLEHNLDRRSQALSVVDSQLQREVVRLLDMQPTRDVLPCHWQVEQVVVTHRQQNSTTDFAEERLEGVELLLLPLSNITAAAAAATSATVVDEVHTSVHSGDQRQEECSTEQAARRLHDCFTNAACMHDLDSSRFPLLSKLIVAYSATAARPHTNSSAEHRWLPSAALPPFTFHPGAERQTSATGRR